MRTSLPLHVMRMSSTLNTLMLSFVKTETVPLSDVLPTLIRDVGKSWNVSVCLDCEDSLQKGSRVTYFVLLGYGDPKPLCDGLRIERPALCWSCLLM